MVSKYRAVKTNGYASKKEARRAAELKLLEKAGEISELREQVRYQIIPAQYCERKAEYVSDFVYVDKNGKRIIEDVKGRREGTGYAMFVLKRKLMLYVHGIRIREV